MRVLLVGASAAWATADVASGYRRALIAAGVEVVDYNLSARLNFVHAALKHHDLAARENPAEVARLASEAAVHEALVNECSWAIVVSAMQFHPNALVALRRAGVRVALIFTESPYSDADQGYTAQFADLVATNDRHSAEQYGWLYLPPAYDPAVHRSVEPDPAARHDALVVGTGWDARVRTLLQVDWSGIDLAIYGHWPQLGTDALSEELRVRAGLHPTPAGQARLGPHYHAGPVANARAVTLYAGAAVCLNDHRASATAQTWNPRVVEVLACGGGLLLTDDRPELAALLGPRGREWFVYAGPADLERRVRRALARSEERAERAAWGRERVAGETFAARVAVLQEALHAAGG